MMPSVDSIGVTECFYRFVGADTGHSRPDKSIKALPRGVGHSVTKRGVYEDAGKMLGADTNLQPSYPSTRMISDCAASQRIART